MKDYKKDVLFFYPSNILGGAELLFIKCADYLSQQTELFNVKYVDYVFGCAYKIGINEKIKLIEYKNSSLDLKEGTIVILPLSYITYVDKFFNNIESLKFLFWSLNPTNLSRQIYFYKNSIPSVNKNNREVIGKSLRDLTENGVIRYMDYNNYFTSSKTFLFRASTIDYLPISVSDFEIKPYNEIHSKYSNDGTITFLWLGRLDADKYFTIVVFLNELEKLSDIRNIQLLIVGIGNKERSIRKKCKDLSFNVEFLGKVYGKDLDDLIDKRVDIGLAMGTSALDIAKRGKPVIVEGFLNKEYAAGVINDFVCVNCLKNFDVVSPGYYDKNGGLSFKDLFDLILADYSNYAYMCEKYVYDNHSMSVIGHKLISAINRVDDSYDKKTRKDISVIRGYIKNTILWKMKMIKNKIKIYIA